MMKENKLLSLYLKCYVITLQMGWPSNKLLTELIMESPVSCKRVQ